MTQRTLEKIIMVACKMANGRIVTLPPPSRHWELGYSGVKGFITSEGRFVNRKQAKKIAKKYMIQFVESGNTDKLYSEDLW